MKKTIKKHSKYLFKTFGEWVCTYVDIAYVSGKNLKSFGTRNYYYIFERITRDDKAFKMIRLNSNQAAKVFHGKKTVEEYLIAKKKYKNNRFKEYISYNFI